MLVLSKLFGPREHKLETTRSVQKLRGALRLAAFAGLCVPLAFLAPNSSLRAQQPTSAAWRTGSAFQDALAARVSVRLSGQELRGAIERLAAAYNVAMFLDRRIDPGQVVDLQVSEQPLRQALTSLAEGHRMGTTLFHSLVYFGPVAAVESLHTYAAIAREEAEKTPAKRKAALLKSTSLEWPELSTPRELIAQTANLAGIQLTGLERVPHDLWPAGSWPAMSVIDRLSLLAIGFELQVHVSPTGDTLTLVPATERPRLVKSYSAGAKPEQIATKLAEYLPEAEFKTSSGKLFVRARWEDHEQVRAALAGQPLTRTTTPASDGAPERGVRVYTLNVQNKPLRPILDALAKQMNLRLELDDAALEAAGIDPQQLVSFQVEGVQRDELWNAALAPVGLAFRIAGDVISVEPKGNP